MKKNCRVCDLEFDTLDRSNNSVYCSKECNYKQHLVRSNEYRNKNKNNPTFIRKKRESNKRYRIKKRKYENYLAVIKECIICEKEFTGHFSKKTCSNTCKIIHTKNTHIENTYIKLTNSESWKLKDIEYKECKKCKSVFQLIHKAQIYCNNSCRNKAQYIRLKKKGYYNKEKLI